MVGQVQVPTVQPITATDESTNKKVMKHASRVNTIDLSSSPIAKKSFDKNNIVPTLNLNGTESNEVQEFRLKNKMTTTPPEINSHRDIATRFRQSHRAVNQENTKNASQDLAELLNNNKFDKNEAPSQEIFIVGKDTQRISVPIDIAEEQKRQLVQNLLDSQRDEQKNASSRETQENLKA